MSTKNYLNSQIGLLVLAVLFFSAVLLFVRPNPPKISDYLAPPTIIEHLSFGQKVQAADSFWLRAIQDFDFCDKPINQTECIGKSWLFSVINLTVELDTRFKEAYYYGALALTVLISDYQGASQIFDKGVVQFPKSGAILYAAGYHALFEEKNKMKASKLYFATAENGGPAWTKVLAARLAADSGEKEYAAKILEQMIADNEDPKLIRRLKEKLAAIQKTN